MMMMSSLFRRITIATLEVIEKAGLIYNKSAEQLKEEKWFEQVKNPRSEDFFQWHDLKQVGIDPPDEIAAKRRYPIKVVRMVRNG